MSKPTEYEVQLLASRIETPSFVYVEEVMGNTTGLLRKSIHNVGVRILFSMKPFANVAGLRYLANCVDGFSVSSLFEARLAREILGSQGIIQFVSPGIHDQEIKELVALCDRVTVNSLSQWYRFGALLATKVECGLRVNPNLSFTDDKRYDPCRAHSKLGVSIADLQVVMREYPRLFDDLKGIHFHNNCVSANWSHLLETVSEIERLLPNLLAKLDWINLGGGYDFSETTDFDPLNTAIDLMRTKYDLEVVIEPGSGLVNSAGYIVSSIIDMFESAGKSIALLDTTINHMPEVFEYQFEPDVVGDVEGGQYEYILAGCSCLAGDLLGEYAFSNPLSIGGRVVFKNVGAYSLVKANMFNGINLPTIYSLTPSGEVKLKKHFTYQDFLSRCGVETHATAPART
jgi:carboxynorspermidine decarboxylase